MQADHMFLMTNLRPNRTGLPFVVYVSVKGCDASVPQIKVSKRYSKFVHEGDWFSITIADQPIGIDNCHSIKGYDVGKVKKWVLINKDELLEIWEDDVDIFDADLKKV